MDEAVSKNYYAVTDMGRQLTDISGIKSFMKMTIKAD